ncbi:hypothetical protein [Longibaculum muris]|uniref:hypothetical protein n=1 Tax=Longibaculum muris TaxID=1796628 RepID=UPI003AB1209C
MSRRLNDDKDNNGYNLKDVLTKETSLSHFLKKYHMTFEYDKYIRMYLCDKEVNLNEKEYYYEYLRQRFGYIYHDYSMKGLMFADDIKNSTDYQMAEGGPELLGYLYLLIDADEFIDEFIRKSTFYQFEYLVPLEQIYFDNYEDLSNDDKQCHIIIKTLQRLYFCKYDPLFNEEDNPTIGIIDNITLSEKYLINKIKIC